MENAKYTFEEAVQAIQELDFGEDICNINQSELVISQGLTYFAIAIAMCNKFR